ncbi:GlxA family transcriptional regulator [Neptunomonas sp.]|uniref:choline metabolism transcriptional regulator GbdR n=1 Tax=Neptunomonas sp. TaxID=1971898 RepID=UPI0025DF8318|nr:GlxA family transcriptional regulator [Neptunomonas sp.]
MNESSTDNQGDSVFITKKVGFMLLNNFTMISLASAVEPLRMANQLSGETLYEWFTLTEEGLPVSASDGIRITPDSSLLDAVQLDTIIVAGGLNVTRAFTKIQLNWLKMQARKGCRLGAVCTGAYVLAEAGLLDGYDCSAHWEYIAALQETFPRVHCSNRLFSIDRDRMTSTGGTVPLDMMLHMIKQEHGTLLCTAISEMFICDRIRSETDKQKIPLQHVSGTTQPKLVEVVGLMEANLEELIDMDELAHYAGLSRRQLERLFLKYLQCSPSKYYLKLRLLRARQLLKQSNLPIIEISTACGFVSTPHFSKCYREQMGVPPSEERSGNSRVKNIKQNVSVTTRQVSQGDQPQRRQLKVQEQGLSDAKKEQQAASLYDEKNSVYQEKKRDSIASDALVQARSESTFGSVRIKK